MSENPILARARRGELLDRAEALALARLPAAELVGAARERRALAHGTRVTYSPKVFVPLTMLCRDVCHYCTFAKPPRRGQRAYLSEEEVLAIARAGAAAGCHEVLFTLGDKPELRYRAAREELAELGFATTIEYLAHCARLVLDETGLLPHANPGVLDADGLALLRTVSASQGLMLESTSERLCERGAPHFGSPDKRPEVRLETLRLAGELGVPFTTGILIGIGETREERLDALLAIRDAHERHGHVQEVIVQNFRAKPGTRMAGHPEPALEEQLWTCAAARLALPAAMHVQAPPNLAGEGFPQLLDAGIDDFGGVSPVTIDHVNPEAPWPEIERLARAARSRGLELAPRLAIYPEHVAELERWCEPRVATAVRRRADASGLAREDGWAAGVSERIPAAFAARGGGRAGPPPAGAGAVGGGRAGGAGGAGRGAGSSPRATGNPCPPRWRCSWRATAPPSNREQRQATRPARTGPEADPRILVLPRCWPSSPPILPARRRAGWRACSLPTSGPGSSRRCSRTSSTHAHGRARSMKCSS